VLLGIELRASHLQGECSSDWAVSPALLFLACVLDRTIHFCQRSISDGDSSTSPVSGVADKNHYTQPLYGPYLWVKKTLKKLLDKLFFTFHWAELNSICFCVPKIITLKEKRITVELLWSLDQGRYTPDQWSTSQPRMKDTILQYTKLESVWKENGAQRGDILYNINLENDMLPISCMLISTCNGVFP
jgi:hypothetical protein